mgnify:CR=1 FL=1
MQKQRNRNVRAVVEARTGMFGLRRARGVVERRVRKGIEPKSQVSIVFTGTFDNTEMNRLTLRAMGVTRGSCLILKITPPGTS